MITTEQQRKAEEWVILRKIKEHTPSNEELQLMANRQTPPPEFWREQFMLPPDMCGVESAGNYATAVVKYREFSQ